MATPSKVYGWDYQLNNVITKPAGQTLAMNLYDLYNKQVMLKIVELLLATDNTNDSAWTHVASSAGATVSKPTAGQDTGATLQWTTENILTLTYGQAISGFTNQAGGVTTGAANPSNGGNWIVLKRGTFFGEGAPLYMTLSLGALNSAATAYKACSIFLSTHRPDIDASATTAYARPLPTGPEITFRTGMTGVAAPAGFTAASFAAQGTVPAGCSWATTLGTGNTAQLGDAPASMVLHLMRHSQGFRFLVSAEGKVFMAAAVEFVQGLGDVGTVGSFSEMPPVVCIWDSLWAVSITTRPTTSPMVLTRYWKERRARMVRGTAEAPGSPFECYLTQETYGQGADPKAISSDTAANEITDEYPLMPVGLYSNASGFAGRHGYIPDLYWGSETYKDSHGASYPSNGTKEWVQFGSLVFPWDSTSAINL